MCSYSALMPEKEPQFTARVSLGSTGQETGVGMMPEPCKE